MTMHWLQFFFGLAIFLGVAWGMHWVFHRVTIEVEDESAVLVTEYGRLVEQLLETGLHFYPRKLNPWVNTYEVSLQRDFRTFKQLTLNDRNGTTVIADLWVEFKVKDPVKALFAVEDWETALKSVVTNAMATILSGKEFKEILSDRSELSEVLRNEIAADTARWGIEIESAQVRDVGLLPEVSRRMFESVAAKLERVKALIDETGRLRIAQLDADTSARIAELTAEAKSRYPRAVGRAYHQLQRKPKVFEAYQELYELSLVQPHKTIYFDGFAQGEMKATDAAMVMPSFFGSQPLA